jgi:DNA sulfur modification protein DndC
VLTEQHDIPMQLVQKLLDAEWQSYGMFRRSSIHHTIEKIFEEDWRSFDDIREVMENMEREQAE